jgi:hypothetical protein
MVGFGLRAARRARVDCGRGLLVVVVVGGGASTEKRIRKKGGALRGEETAMW